MRCPKPRSLPQLPQGTHQVLTLPLAETDLPLTVTLEAVTKGDETPNNAPKNLDEGVIMEMVSGDDRPRCWVCANHPDTDKIALMAIFEDGNDAHDFRGGDGL